MIPVLSSAALVGAAATGRHFRIVHSTQGRHRAAPGQETSSLGDLHAEHHTATETALSDLLAEVRAARAAGVRLVPEGVTA